MSHTHPKDWKKHFASCYDRYCALHSCCPLASITCSLGDNAIDCNVDRIRLAEWEPILDALRSNQSLSSVAFRSVWENLPPNEELQQRAYLLKRKPPSIRSKDIPFKLCRSLRECLSRSTSLASLTLQGIRFSERDLRHLAKGIHRTVALKHLSLEFSKIGDSGWEVLCPPIKGCLSILSLNVSGCDLSSKSADSIAVLIKNQSTKRYGTAWQESLRYRKPDLDQMPGLRRINLCHNPQLGDAGARFLADALKDDLWVRAIDLQQCGISSDGAECFQDMLQFNSTLFVLDVRLNLSIEQGVLKAILGGVLGNSKGEHEQYPWLVTRQPQDSNRNTRLGVTNKKPKSVKPKRPKARRLSNQATTAKHRTPSLPYGHRAHFDHAQGYGDRIPWRTAERMHRKRYCETDATENAPDRYPDRAPDHSPDLPRCERRRRKHVETEPSPSLPLSESIQEGKTFTSATHSIEGNSPGGVLRVEINLLRKRLLREIEARTSVEARLQEIESENKDLRDENKLLRDAVTKSGRARKRETEGGAAATLLSDDNVLESIEKSFKQFKTFLDLLQASGTDCEAMMMKASTA